MEKEIQPHICETADLLKWDKSNGFGSINTI
jgi:hypothetical protein